MRACRSHTSLNTPATITQKPAHTNTPQHLPAVSLQCLTRTAWSANAREFVSAGGDVRGCSASPRRAAGEMEQNGSVPSICWVEAQAGQVLATAVGLGRLCWTLLLRDARSCGATSRGELGASAVPSTSPAVAHGCP